MNKKLIIGAFVALAFSGCRKEKEFENIQNPAAPTNTVYQEILKLGFSPDEIKEYNDYYLVHGDISFSKNRATANNTRQSHCGCLIDPGNLDVLVYMDDSSFPTIGTDLSAALDQAIIEYNAINYTNLQLTRDNTGGHININNGVIPSGACAIAEFPLFGVAGNTIVVDESTVTGLSVSELTFLLVHEIGHALGLRHTDWRSSGEQESDEYCGNPVHIPATPEDDASSVMNSGTCSNAWSGFSTYDERAIQVIYPENVSAQWGTGHGSVANCRKGDFNGDGKTDIVQFSSGNSFVWLSNGSSSSYTGQWGTGHGNINDIRVADFTGDGKTDIAQFASNGASYVWVSTGSSFSYAGQWGSGHGSSAQVLHADFNNDNREDVVQIVGGNSFVWLSTGSAFNSYGQWGSGHGLITEVKMADMNADGRDDIVQFISSGNSYAWLSTGSNFSYAGLTGTGHGSSLADLFIADYNGDGRQDVMQINSGNSFIWLSTGTSYSYQGQWGSGHGGSSNIKVLDMSGDGKDDIVQISEGVVFRWLSTGSSFGSFRIWSSGHGTAAENFTGKFNSDNKLELMQIAGNGNSYVWITP